MINLVANVISQAIVAVYGNIVPIQVQIVILLDLALMAKMTYVQELLIPAPNQTAVTAVLQITTVFPVLLDHPVQAAMEMAVIIANPGLKPPVKQMGHAPH